MPIVILMTDNELTLLIVIQENQASNHVSRHDSPARPFSLISLQIHVNLPASASRAFQPVLRARRTCPVHRCARVHCRHPAVGPTVVHVPRQASVIPADPPVSHAAPPAVHPVVLVSQSVSSQGRLLVARLRSASVISRSLIIIVYCSK